jgi:hypothetical protein
MATWTVLGATFVLVLFSARGSHGPDTTRSYPSRSLPPEPAPVLLPPPPMAPEYWPCSDCHEGETPNRKVREFEDEHDELELRHGKLWCFDCHDANEKDMLHLTDGKVLEIGESWRLCTQCHGLKLAAWRAGVHGRRTGHWWGSKEYRSCVECHDPHAPLFKPLEPLPPPWRPTEIRWTGYGRAETSGE